MYYIAIQQIMSIGCFLSMNSLLLFVNLRLFYFPAPIYFTQFVLKKQLQISMIILASLVNLVRLQKHCASKTLVKVKVTVCERYCLQCDDCSFFFEPFCKILPVQLYVILKFQADLVDACVHNHQILHTGVAEFTALSQVFYSSEYPQFLKHTDKVLEVLSFY